MVDRAPYQCIYLLEISSRVEIIMGDRKCLRRFLVYFSSFFVGCPFQMLLLNECLVGWLVMVDV